jgi:uncharacterized protein
MLGIIIRSIKSAKGVRWSMLAEISEVTRKIERLKEWFGKSESVIVAYSGGVDSSLLAVVAYDVLRYRSVAVLADSPAVSRSEIRSAMLLAEKMGFSCKVVMQDDLSNVDYVRNAPDRCFHCRSALVSLLREVAEKEGIELIVDGTNVDDLGSFRPGIKALREGGSRAPLVELGFGKKDVREMAAELGIPVHDKPSNSCLSSRIQYGQPVTKEALERIERAETFICNYLGLKAVRVRDHGNLARIELLPNELGNILNLEKIERVDRELKNLGYTYVTLDLQGYRSGSMNEIFKAKPKLPIV